MWVSCPILHKLHAKKIQKERLLFKKTNHYLLDTWTHASVTLGKDSMNADMTHGIQGKKRKI